MIDKVPMVNYGAIETVNPLTTVYVVLYPVPDYTTDQELLYEDDVTQGLFLERISGTVYSYWEEAQGISVGLALLPMGVDYDTQSVLEISAAPWSIFATQWANQPHWWKRYFTPLPGVGAEPPQAVDHPWWTRVDVKPRRMMGVRKNQWPVLAIRNYDSVQRVVVRHLLEAWYK